MLRDKNGQFPISGTTAFPGEWSLADKAVKTDTMTHVMKLGAKAEVATHRFTICWSLHPFVKWQVILKATKQKLNNH